MRVNRYTAEQCAWLKANRPSMRLEEMANAFNAEFCTQATPTALQNKCLSIGVSNPHQIVKGNQPWNKGKKTGIVNRTTFKPKNTPWRVADIGHIRKNHHGFLEFKAEDGSYIKVHRHLYEKQHGPISDDDFVIFLDGNKENIDPANLFKISRREHLALNTREDFGPHNPPEINLAIIATVKLEVAAKIKAGL